MAGFSWYEGIAAHREATIRLPMANGATISKGDVLEFSSAGKLQRINAQTDVGLFVAAEDYTTTSTEFYEIAVYRTAGGIFKIGYTPLVDDVAATSGGTTTTIKVALTDGSSNDLIGAAVYCRELGVYRIVTANTYSSNVVTLTFIEPLARALTTSDHVRLVPFGPGTRTLKFGASNMQRTVGTAVGDQSSGKLTVEQFDVNHIAKKFALVSFLQS